MVEKDNSYLTSNIIIVLLILLSCDLLAQITESNAQQSYRVVFYNLENYFDAEIDTSLNYNEYTPEGELHWTTNKFKEKTNNIYKVVQALSTWDGITMAGICEIENKNVIEALLYNTPLKKYSYNYIHYNSPDNRGIDVALIYGPELSPISSRVYSISDPQLNKINTRDILYVKALLKFDTIHVFVNHWTSRYRGLMESKPLRMQFSNLLKSKTDSIYNIVDNPKVIIMGDFNDQAFDDSLLNLSKDGRLLNLKASPLENNSQGTLKYKSDWYIFDQVLVSQSLKEEGESLTICDEGLKIFDSRFLLENDDKYLGLKPFRTNIGYKYNGGYSDHLPIYFDLRNNTE